MRAEELLKRWRRAVPGNTLAMSQGAGPRIPMIGECYRHIRSGRMVTVTASSSLEVGYHYDFYKELCGLSLEQFDKQFKRVGV